MEIPFTRKSIGILKSSLTLFHIKLWVFSVDKSNSLDIWYGLDASILLPLRSPILTAFSSKSIGITVLDLFTIIKSNKTSFLFEAEGANSNFLETN